MELTRARIAILGLGLMGGSLSLALQGKCVGLYGADPQPETLAMAASSQVFKAISDRPEDVLSQADLVVLATPVGTILDLLAELPKLHPGSPIVLDLGSTKRQIIDAMALLPDRFDPLGGHPMCGKEKNGWQNASPDLFQGAPFAFTALPRTSERARALAEQLAWAVGARPIWLAAETHDRWTAATSHLPYLLASALALSTPEEVAPLAGPGFHSTTRVAGTSPEIMLDILCTNTDLVLAALDRFQGQLDSLRTALENGDRAILAELLRQATAQRKAVINEQKAGSGA